ncbi:MAG: hypothetical protein K6C12_01020 [Oscillospiraceae bacterium]|nr:hypothetical protein [Oscillospiraceae bacterium]
MHFSTAHKYIRSNGLDVFGSDPEKAFVDIRAKVIYDGNEGDILDQYITFCRVFDEQVKLHGRTKTAIEETIRICRSQDVLSEYLARKEAAEIMSEVFEVEDSMKLWERDLRAEGEAEGNTKGQNKLAALMTKLFSLGRVSDAERAASDAAYRQQLYQEFQIA